MDPCAKHNHTVYDISILSNIPSSVADILDPDAPTQRLRPLFTVGVHDIPSLVEYQAPKDSAAASQADDDAAVAEDSGCGWIACTTDSILAVKGELWDMLITMPPPYASSAKEKAWPTVESPKGVPVRATQRDLRRFKHLQSGLARLTKRPSQTPSRTASGSAPTPGARPASSSPQTQASDASDDNVIRLSRPNASSSLLPRPQREPVDIADYESDKIVEPSTWAALAYGGFMWWASAGEQRRGEEADEAAQDAALFADLRSPPPPAMGGGGGMTATTTPRPPLVSLGGRGGEEEEEIVVEEEDDEDARATVELAVIAYFHRLTTQMLSVLADIVDSSDEDDMLGLDVASVSGGGEGQHDDDSTRRLLAPGGHIGDEDEDDGEGGLGAWIRVDSDALARMGLDVWSHGDVEFVKDLALRYFGRRAYVEGKGVEVCGLRVC